MPDGRIDIGPINAQLRFASGDGLFRPLSMDDVHHQLAMLEQLDLGMIGIGGHDSSDQVIAMAKSSLATLIAMCGSESKLSSALRISKGRSGLQQREPEQDFTGSSGFIIASQREGFLVFGNITFLILKVLLPRNATPLPAVLLVDNCFDQQRLTRSLSVFGPQEPPTPNDRH